MSLSARLADVDAARRDRVLAFLNAGIWAAPCGGRLSLKPRRMPRRIAEVNFVARPVTGAKRSRRCRVDPEQAPGHIVLVWLPCSESFFPCRAAENALSTTKAGLKMFAQVGWTSRMAQFGVKVTLGRRAFIETP